MVRRLLSAFLVLDLEGAWLVEVFVDAPSCVRDEYFRLLEPCSAFEVLELEPRGVHPSWAACLSCGRSFLIGGRFP